MLAMLALAPCDTAGSTSNTPLQSVRKPIAELKGTALLWDCVDNPGDTKNAKGCIFCGLKFPGGPSRMASTCWRIQENTPRSVNLTLFGYNGTRKWLQS